MAVFAGRLVLDAQPPIDDAVLGPVAERCAGPLPGPLIALWRTAFGGRLDYDLRIDLDGQDVPLSFAELFYPGSGGYHDLWGWIDHECELAEESWPDWSGQLIHLPIGGFEYLERVYVDTAAGPERRCHLLAGGIAARMGAVCRRPRRAARRRPGCAVWTSRPGAGSLGDRA
ncbi:hypothetical protein [Spirillospora sp. CA-128828]|uniref:hypothetical protein n=1 Tax=Spirillospora sp. CA-128828 TaxID=3240033 RepID=UPI003D90AFDF